MFAAWSNRTSPGWPMKFVATPRPEKNDWKSIVGPWIVAFRPPAHSTCATFRPPRSADCAIDSACSTLASNADVRVLNAAPFLWNVLFVEPWTPGHAPVARLYQPAPVFGGACVRIPLPLADVPFFRKSDIVGSRPCAEYRATMSCRMPSAVKKTALSTTFSLAAAVPAPETLAVAADPATKAEISTSPKMAGTASHRLPIVIPIFSSPQWVHRFCPRN